MLCFDWNDEKNEWLRRERDVTFPQVIHRVMSERDLTKLQVRALEEGLSYQTFISSILHKFVTGRLVDAATSSLAAGISPEIEGARVDAGLTNNELLTIVREQGVRYRAEDDNL